MKWNQGKNPSLRLLISIFLILGLLLSGCGSRDALIAVWQSEDAAIILQFKDDGTVVVSNEHTSISLPYEKQDPNILLIKTSSIGDYYDQSLRYRIDEGKLILTLDGVDSVFLLVQNTKKKATP